MKEGAPVRFLLLLAAGWIGLRAVMLSGSWSVEPMQAAISQPPPSIVAQGTPAPTGPGADAIIDHPATQVMPSRTAPTARRPVHLAAAVPSSAARSGPESGPASASVPIGPHVMAMVTPVPASRPASLAAAPADDRRWSGAAWLLQRRDGDVALAPGGTLGGSQAGARLLYRLNDNVVRPLALSGRAYVPLRRPAGAEAALGVDWRPNARLPVHLLVERRQRLGSEGRSAFAATVYGGGSVSLGPSLRLDGYAQTGMVGLRSRDFFVDGAARLSRTMGPLELGGAIWGAAQPGAARLDAGPQLSAPLRTGDATLRLSAEYRFRIAGDARPASGPSLTLGVDF